MGYPMAGYISKAGYKFKFIDLGGGMGISYAKENKLLDYRKYNNAISITKHFKDDGKGGLVVTAPEGYVAVDRIGQGVKFVDRVEFSRANFAMDKGFTK